jgi:molybdopterin-guanine dinucleotide biosynthesis protein A
MKQKKETAGKSEIGISGVILAGGVNKRFSGLTKSNIVIDGKKIITRITDTLKDIFNEIIIVTNNPDEFKEFSNYRIIPDQYLNVGPLGGIHAALKSSSNETVFIFAGDMPLLDKEIIIRQIEYYKTHKCDILIPRINSNIEPLHAIYNISVISVLEKYLSMNHDYAVREFFKNVNVGIMEMDDSDDISKAFTNINTPDDISIFSNFISVKKLKTL